VTGCVLRSDDFAADHLNNSDHPRVRQGDLEIHKAEDGEEALGIPGEFSSGGGDLGVIVQSTQRDGGVPDGRQLLGSAAGANAAVILLKGHVADPVQAVLDRPMTADEVRQLGGVGLIA
jgi:hypothetical protein